MDEKIANSPIKLAQWIKYCMECGCNCPSCRTWRQGNISEYVSAINAQYPFWKLTEEIVIAAQKLFILL